MASSINRLTARAVQTIAKPGRHADGGNLYLAVAASGARSWLFIYRHGAKQREMGLGSARSISLAHARELANAARRSLAAGVDPLSERRKPKRLTFGEAADAHIEAMQSAWRNAKHRAQWRMTLETYAAPIRGRAVDEVDTADVLAVLKPIWSKKPETASRLRGRIESVLDAAKAQGLRNGDNPARWRGHLDSILPRPKRLARGHHKAMPYQDVPSFAARLRTMPGVAAAALRFAILCAARTGETLGITAAEVDLERRLWTVPGERMKGGREHRVPLSDQAIEILRPRLESTFIFSGKPHRPLSNMALEMVLRRMKVDVTVHGFRSSFRDWVGEETLHPGEVAEAALAHLVGDETERAYRRGDALEKRRLLMADWARFCESATVCIDNSRGPEAN